MSDAFKEVTQVSWFGRIKSAVGGLVIGLLLIAAMVFLLFWNEGRAVQTAKSLAEGAAAVISISPDTVDAANDGRLVHLSGAVIATETPTDADFGISQPGVRLVRTVEMYQWKETAKSETKTKLGGGEETVTTYSYAKGWDEDAIDSGRFKQPDGHANPPKELNGRSFQIPDARLGAFTLDEPVLNRVGGEQTLPLPADMSGKIDDAYRGNQRVSVVDGRIFLGFNPTTPAIGDYRISYAYAPAGVISIVGKQVGDRFAPYQTLAGDQLLMVDSGAVPADKMFADAMTANTVVTWILRLVGLLLLFIGFALVMGPIAVVADFIPFLGTLTRMGTGIIAALLAVLLGTATIALAWFYYRPLLALGIVAAGLLVAAGITYLGRKRRGAIAAPSAPAPATATPSSKW